MISDDFHFEMPVLPSCAGFSVFVFADAARKQEPAGANDGVPTTLTPFKIQENQHMDSFFLAKPHFLELWRFSLLINTHVDCGCFWNPTHHDAFPLLQ
jgi:hypothetical protein